MAEANYSDILNKSLRFAVHPKRWLPFFLIHIVFGSLVLAIILGNPGLFSALMAGTADISTMGALMFAGLTVVGLFAVWMLLNIWIQGAVVQQSANEKETISASLSYSLKRYPSLLLVTIIVGVISGLVGMVPFIGLILSIIVGVVFVFVNQAVIISKQGFAESMKVSYDMFVKRKWPVFLAWLVTAIVAGIITLIALAPAIIGLGVTFIQAILTTGGTASLGSFMSILYQNIYLLVSVAVVFAIGISISAAFSLKSLTEFYKAWSKRKLF